MENKLNDHEKELTLWRNLKIKFWSAPTSNKREKEKCIRETRKKKTKSKAEMKQKKLRWESTIGWVIILWTLVLAMAIQWNGLLKKGNWKSQVSLNFTRKTQQLTPSQSPTTGMELQLGQRRLIRFRCEFFFLFYLFLRVIKIQTSTSMIVFILAPTITLTLLPNTLVW